MVFLVLLLVGCTSKSSIGEIWVETERNFGGQVFAIEDGYSYLKYLDGELVFIEENGNEFKFSRIYYVKQGDLYYYSSNKLIDNRSFDDYEGTIKIEKTETELTIICEKNDYIKSYKRVEDQSVIDKFNY